MEPFKFDMPKNKNSAIKVVGVGGGGNNAVNYMYNEGIEGVDFIICNTDAQALENSPISNKIQLGVSITEGLGAGANPEIGEKAALESMDEIKAMFETNTKMVFITAGMGGGTGTGAAPVIAGISKEMGILTVGIVTVPFQFEGKARLDSAHKGVEIMRQNVDSLIVINNDKLRDLYGNLGYKSGFSKADEVLAIAAKGIAEVITKNYNINIDLRDAKTVLSDSGTAIMGSCQAEGDNRAKESVAGALDSPLLNDNTIVGAKNVLLLIVSGAKEITIDEIGVISDYIQLQTGNNTNIIMGMGEDLELQDAVSVTVVATGFPMDEQIKTGSDNKKIIHTLRDEQAISKTIFEKDDSQETLSISSLNNDSIIKHTLEDEEEEQESFETKANETIIEDNAEETLAFTVHTTQAPTKVENPNPAPSIENKIEHTLEEEVEEEKTQQTTIFTLDDFEQENKKQETANTQTVANEIEPEPTVVKEPIAQVNIQEEGEEDHTKAPNEELINEINKRKDRLKIYNTKYSNLSTNVDETEKIPAYKRQGIQLDESQQSNTSNFYLDTDEDEVQLRPNNFFDDNVD